MAYGFLDIAGTPSVRAAQAAMGSDHLWTGRDFHRDFDRFTPQEVQFIAERDSFSMARSPRRAGHMYSIAAGPAGS